jgi:hypothetical protein
LPTSIEVAQCLGGESVDPFDATTAKSVPGTGAKNRATPLNRAKWITGKLMPIHLCDFVEENVVERYSTNWERKRQGAVRMVGIQENYQGSS